MACVCIYICGLVVFEQIAEQTSGKSNSVGINFGSVESQVNHELNKEPQMNELSLNGIEQNWTELNGMNERTSVVFSK